MGLGGMVLRAVPDEERSALGVADGKMALKVGHVGAYSPHDRAKKAGIIKGDILLEYDGRSDLVRESDLLAYAINSVNPGQSVKLRLLRGKNELQVEVKTAE
jgi:S1-C subfamily serine protease